MRGVLKMGMAAGLAGVLAVGAGTPDAKAGLRFCNESGRTQNVAVGYQHGDDWASEGWWVLRPGECKVAIGGDLKWRTYYYRIKSGGVSRKEGANYYFCTKTQPFTIIGTHNRHHCSSRGYYRRGFKKVNVADALDFTINIR
jgi:uncharacterized membrane protein